MKIFISQPMKGKNETEIETIRYNAKAFLEEYFKQDIDLGGLLVSQAQKASNKSVDILGQAVSLLADCQIAVFVDGWQKARGCLVEHQVCEYYGIPALYMAADGTGWRKDDPSEW